MRVSLVLRGVLALVLMVLFYLLAIGAVIGLVVGGVAALSNLRGSGSLVLGVGCLLAAAMVAWSMLPRPDRFEPPGPTLTPTDAPGLFEVIREVSARTGQREPDQVYLVPGVNAFVTHRGGLLGIGSKRVMGVGLALLEALRVDELRAVLAHEYGHFAGGDVALGAWIYKTRGAIVRTVVNLGKVRAVGNHLPGLALISAIAHAPFRGFLWVFLRVTQAINRAQELGADALAARVYGSATMASALRCTEEAAPRYALYAQGDLEPVVAAGYRPPIAEGFRAFLAAELQLDLPEREPDPFDSHPPTWARIAAIEALAIEEADADPRPAIELLGDLAMLEEAMAILLGAPGLRPIAWVDVPDKVQIPAYRRELRGLRAHLAGLTPATLPRDRRALALRLEALLGFDPTAREVLIGTGTRLFGLAITVALLDAGHRLISDLGKPVEIDLGGERIEPFDEVRAYLAEETDAEAWTQRVTAWGIADVELGR